MLPAPRAGAPSPSLLNAPACPCAERQDHRVLGREVRHRGGVRGEAGTVPGHVLRGCPRGSHGRAPIHAPRSLREVGGDPRWQPQPLGPWGAVRAGHLVVYVLLAFALLDTPNSGWGSLLRTKGSEPEATATSSPSSTFRMGSNPPLTPRPSLPGSVPQAVLWGPCPSLNPQLSCLLTSSHWLEERKANVISSPLFLLVARAGESSGTPASVWGSTSLKRPTSAGSRLEGSGPQAQSRHTGQMEGWTEGRIRENGLMQVSDRDRPTHETRVNVLISMPY